MIECWLHILNNIILRIRGTGPNPVKRKFTDYKESYLQKIWLHKNNLNSYLNTLYRLSLLTYPKKNLENALQKLLRRITQRYTLKLMF